MNRSFITRNLHKLIENKSIRKVDLLTTALIVEGWVYLKLKIRGLLTEEIRNATRGCREKATIRTCM